MFAAPTPTGPNWLENPPDGSRILVRQIYSEWADAAPGEVHIDRLGHEGDAKPAPTGADMAGRLRRAAANLVPHVRIWPEMVRVGYVERLGANRLSPPFDPGTLGGVPGRWMASGSFDLEPDDALIVTTWPAGGDYQGIQLADLWFSSLEYANRQTSLTGDQARLDDDGAYRFVVSATDPGVPNWLDTMGRRRGAILLRYDGTGRSAFDPSEHPSAMVVPVADVRRHLPASTPVMRPEDRRATLARRRRHVQRRFGC